MLKKQNFLVFFYQERLFKVKREEERLGFQQLIYQPRGDSSQEAVFMSPISIITIEN